MRIVPTLLLLALASPALASGGGSNPPPIMPPIVITPYSTPAAPASPEEDRSKNMFWGGAVAGGLAITALQKTERPWLYTALGGAVIAVAGKHAADWSGKEARYAFGGVLVGATGTGLVFGEKFFGWKTAIKF